MTRTGRPQGVYKNRRNCSLTVPTERCQTGYKELFKDDTSEARVDSNPLYALDEASTHELSLPVGDSKIPIFPSSRFEYKALIN